MQIHELKRRTENRKTAIVGRGGKRGKPSLVREDREGRTANIVTGKQIGRAHV